MQAYKHTPGPLKAVQNAPDAFFLKDSEGQNVAEIYAVAEKHYPRIEANATLYALAPELVDALMTAYQNAVLTESEHARIRDVIRRIPGYKEPDRFAKKPSGYTNAETNCKGCFGPCGQCKEPAKFIEGDNEPKGIIEPVTQ